MPNGPGPSRARRLAGSLSLGAVAAGLAVLALFASFVAPPLFALAAMLGLAAIGLSSRSVTTQVFARGAAWLALAPALVASAGELLHGHAPPLALLGVVAGSGAAIWLSAPMLETAEARAAFHPLRYRRWLLSAASTAVTAGLVMGAGVIPALFTKGLAAGAGLLVLALALFASAFGVTRMRAWGILLGAATSALALAAAVAVGGNAAILLSLAAAPGLLLAAPIVAARLDASAPSPSAASPSAASASAASPGAASASAAGSPSAGASPGAPVRARVSLAALPAPADPALELTDERASVAAHGQV